MHHRTTRLLNRIGIVALSLCAGTAAAQVPVVTTLDSAGDVGQYSDVALRADRRGFVAYTDATSARLKVASCQDVACTSALLGPIDPDGPFDSVSVAIGADGRPVVAYQHRPSATVRVARCVDADCTAAEVVTVDAGEGFDGGTDIVIGADALPLVVYGSDGQLRVAHCEDAGCGTRTVTPYADVNVLVSRPTAALGLDGRVVFAGAHSPDLRVGHCSNLACTAATFTRLVGTSSPSFVRAYGSPSIALGGDGRMALTFYRSEQGFPFPPPAVLLELRRCTDAACSGLGPNTLPVSLAGQGPMIAMAPGDRPVLAQYGGDGGLRLTVRRCTTPACPSGSPVTTIDGEFVGDEHALAVSPLGDVTLSYSDGVNDDLKVAWLGSPAEIAIADVAIQEGHAGQTLAVLAVSLGGGDTATVDFATADGTATAGVDYLPASGTLTLTPGAPVQTVTVPIVGDSLPEPDETFRVLLSKAVGAPIVDGEGFGTIVDDEPHVTLSDVTLVEGDAGAADALFVVSLDAAGGPVQVDFATEGLTATSGVDFFASAGTLSFAPGETSRAVTVSVVGDLAVEPDETFRVLLSNPQGAVLDDPEGLGTITNDDGPGIAIADGSVVEGTTGNVVLSLVVTLDAPSPSPVTVQYATSGITATSGSDFLAASGVVSFAPGETARTATVLVVGDFFVEPDETLRVTLSSPAGGVILDAEGIGTILNDDAPALPAAPEFAEMRHGSTYEGTVSGLDDDDFALSQAPYASYEVVVDGISGEASLVDLRRLDALGNELQVGTDVGTGSAESLRWRVAGTEPVADEVVRVDRSCGILPCLTVVYRVRAYETTLRAARFNNSATQTTVVVLQNTGDAPVTPAVHFWAADGTLVATHAPASPIPPHGLLVLDTSTVAPGASGSVTVGHDAPYGVLVGKAVAVEPATGFAFDTPLQPRPR